MIHYSLDALMLEDKFRKQMYGKLLARQPYRRGGAPHGDSPNSHVGSVDNGVDGVLPCFYRQPRCRITFSTARELYRGAV